MIEWWKINFTKKNINSVTQSLKDKRISQGLNNLKFEKKISKLLDVKYCVSTTSGTTAIMLGLKALGIKSGDEVILPNRNWIASANVLMYLGIKLKLIDVIKNSQIIDVKKIEENINKKTKLILTAHLNGKSPNMEKVLQIAKKNNLFIMEDAAQALMAKNKNQYLGTYGDLGIFSMAMTKILSTGQGGFVVTNKKKIYDKMLKLKNHGLKNPFDLKWNNQDGLNFKFTDYQAALAISQLGSLKSRVKKLKENYLIYKKGLENLNFIKVVEYDFEKGELPLWIECECRNRNKVISLLNKNKIQARRVYPSLNKLNRFYSGKKKFPNSDNFDKNFLYLPSGVDIKKKL
jgi:perosamine synthetase